MAVDLGKAKQILSKTFLEDHENIAEDKAAELIVKAELQIKSLRQDMQGDEKLNAAQQVAKDLKSSYTSVIKYEEAKIQYLLAKIEEIQDGSVNPSSSTNS